MLPRLHDSLSCRIASVRTRELPAHTTDPSVFPLHALIFLQPFLPCIDPAAFAKYPTHHAFALPARGKHRRSTQDCTYCDRRWEHTTSTIPQARAHTKAASRLCTASRKQYRRMSALEAGLRENNADFAPSRIYHVKRTCAVHTFSWHPVVPRPLRAHGERPPHPHAP